MNKEQIFEVWSPEHSVWSRWVKPVLFAHMETAAADPQPEADAVQVDWAPSVGNRTALVLDLPGKLGVEQAVALAALGYRPVPLYNAVPPPPTSPASNIYFAAVNVRPIMEALAAGAAQLASLEIPADAPPAFLLDANREGDGRLLRAHEFDNRSISFTTDFPSANFMAAHGITRVLLVQDARFDPRPDLAHTLLRWQEGGLQLERIRLDKSTHRPDPFDVPRPPRYAAMFQRALAAAGFSRAKGGGFGKWIEESASGG